MIIPSTLPASNLDAPTIKHIFCVRLDDCSGRYHWQRETGASIYRSRESFASELEAYTAAARIAACYQSLGGSRLLMPYHIHRTLVADWRAQGRRLYEYGFEPDMCWNDYQKAGYAEAEDAASSAPMSVDWPKSPKVEVSK